MLVALLSIFPAVLAEIEDPGSFQLITGSTNLPTGFSHPKAVVLGQNIYYCVAQNNAHNLYRYTPASNAFTNLPPLANSAIASDTTVISGYINLFGGNTAGATNAHYFIAADNPPSSWTQLPNAIVSPPPRFGHRTTLIGGELFLFGGWDTQQYYSDSWVIDSTLFHIPNQALTWTEITHTGPSARNSFSSVAYGDSVYVFGGFYHNVSAGSSVHCTGQYDGCRWYNDFWRFNARTRTWSVITSVNQPPHPRSEHSAAVLGNKMYVFGGQVYLGTRVDGSMDYEPSNHLFYYDFTTNEWSRVHPAVLPPARQNPAAVFFGNQMYLFGGYSGTANLTDLWAYTPGVAADIVETPPEQEVSASQAQATVIVNILFTLAVLFFHVWQYRKTLSSPRS